MLFCWARFLCCSVLCCACVCVCSTIVQSESLTQFGQIHKNPHHIRFGYPENNWHTFKSIAQWTEWQIFAKSATNNSVSNCEQVVAFMWFHAMEKPRLPRHNGQSIDCVLLFGLVSFEKMMMSHIRSILCWHICNRCTHIIRALTQRHPSLSLFFYPDAHLILGVCFISFRPFRPLPGTQQRKKKHSIEN